MTTTIKSLATEMRLSPAQVAAIWTKLPQGPVTADADTVLADADADAIRGKYAAAINWRADNTRNAANTRSAAKWSDADIDELIADETGGNSPWA